ncbi:hypothetical protein DQG23_20485 [Paenibacillus contaminans]|uniref:Uncharacterized protein n=1 Tax=Paenibacillus contaminans TaxID=450362 RepID=A0A329MII1_9BACL|nr:hypothetical protein DQG23_20485 [Paenibacillus contaminans]
MNKYKYVPHIKGLYFTGKRTCPQLMLTRPLSSKALRTAKPFILVNLGGLKKIIISKNRQGNTG